MPLAKFGAVLMIYGQFRAFFGSFLPYFLRYLACILPAHLTRLFRQWGSHSGQEA